MPDEHMSLDERGLSYANQLLEAVLTRVGSQFVMGWSVRNDLFVYDSNGTVVDTIDIPVARRRGVPENLRYRLDVERVPLRERFTASSRLVQLTSFPDGGLAVIHNDEEILSDEGPIPVTAARPWLSVITPDRHFACVDGRVPASLDAMAAASFSGDTLLVIDRRIVSDDELETWLVTYRIDTSSCDWLPLSRR